MLGTEDAGYPHGQLEIERSLDGTALKRLTTLLEEMPQDHGGPHSCPMDIGSVDLLMFRLPSDAVFTIHASATGCPYFANGRYITGDFSPQYANYLALVNSLAPRSDRLG